jgi:hypothetical protein
MKITGYYLADDTNYYRFLQKIRLAQSAGHEEREFSKKNKNP